MNSLVSLEKFKEKTTLPSIHAEAILYEQLALKRLRWRSWPGWGWGKLVSVVKGLAFRAELVREVGPGIPPLAKNEWERIDLSDRNLR